MLSPFSVREKFFFTLKEIEYSNAYEENWELFNKGISILEQRLNTENFEEFSDDERELFEEIYVEMEKRKEEK